MATPQPTACAQVLAIPELVESILLQVEPEGPTYLHPLEPTTALFALKRINRKFDDVITNSKALQQRMYNPPINPPFYDRTGAIGCAAEYGYKLRKAVLTALHEETTTGGSLRDIRLDVDGKTAIMVQVLGGEVIEAESIVTLDRSPWPRHWNIPGDKTWGDVVDRIVELRKNMKWGDWRKT